MKDIVSYSLIERLKDNRVRIVTLSYLGLVWTTVSNWAMSILSSGKTDSSGARGKTFETTYCRIIKREADWLGDHETQATSKRFFIIPIIVNLKQKNFHRIVASFACLLQGLRNKALYREDWVQIHGMRTDSCRGAASKNIRLLGFGMGFSGGWARENPI